MSAMPTHTEMAHVQSDGEPLRHEIQVAVLVPCRNEEAAIASVVRSFQRALPRSAIYVYDNNSADRTAEVARGAGAIVRTEPLQGKGHVVRRMFSDVEADVYVLVDGDDTYCAASSSMMVAKLLDEQLDMVNGARDAVRGGAYRLGHRFGNMLLTSMVALIFGNRFEDLLSGYRVLSRRYVKSFPALSAGFELETELTVYALQLCMPVAEVTIPYKPRGPRSLSKLKTCRDGLRILTTIFDLMKGERPLLFFSIGFALLCVTSLALAYPVFVTYERTGLVPRFPTAILSSASMLLAFLCLFTGIILDTVTHGRRELKRLHYLQIPAPKRPE